MKLIGYLLMTAALVLGAVSATTAYVPPLTLNDAAFKNSDGSYAILWDPAGKNDQGDAIAAKGVSLDPATLTSLRAAGVERVRVRTFSLDRWSHKWYFLASCAGLLIGGFLVKSAVKNEARMAPADTQPSASPEAATAAIIDVVRRLVADLPYLPRNAIGMEEIIARLDPVQKEFVPTIVDSRSRLLGRLGMGGYAQFMDRFSAMERQLNRAWSAAADGVAHEAHASLHAANALIPEVEARLKG